MTTVTELIKERFMELTEVQKIAIPKILNKKNILIFAPTGSGKTEAALLPILENIKREDPGIQCLYISPLRSLNRDLLRRFNWWCEKLNVSHDVRHGDTTQAERSKHRKEPPQIMIITCETLQALMLGAIMRKHLSNVRFVIVDEIHDILDNKRGAQLSMGLERLEELTPNFLRIGISATVAKEKEAADLLFGNRPYEIAEVGKNRKLDISVEHYEKQEERVSRIKELVNNNRVLLFVNTRSTAEELGATLKKEEANIEIHHGSLSKEVRIAAEEKFKNGEVNSLIATSSLELGIDIGDINLVIQYNSPHQVFRLLQRVGRSGHSLEKTPKGIIIPMDLDDRLEAEVITILAKNKWLEKKQTEKGALDVIAHQLVGICLDKGAINLETAHNILSRSSCYGISYNKLKKVALQLYSQNLLHYDELEGKEFVKIKSRAREYYYSNLSTIPKEKRFAMREMSSNRIVASLDEAFVMNLDNNSSFLAKAQAWQVVDITEQEVIVTPSPASDVLVPDWTGEDIPVEYEVATGVAELRKRHKKFDSANKIIVEIVQDLIVLHSCFGSKVNESLARMISYSISRLIGEPVRAVSDPYRIMIKLPFQLDGTHIVGAITGIRDVRSRLEQSLENSFLLKFKFTHVARMFGMINIDSTVNHRLVHALRNSVVYEETLRSIFFRYFDVEKTQEVISGIKNGKIGVLVENMEKPSFFASLGIERLGANESIGVFQPREHMISTLRERTLMKTFDMICLSCGATRFMFLGGAKDPIACHKCGEKSLTIRKNEMKKPEQEHAAALIRNYGKKALVAMAVYGIGASTAERVLKKLHRSEDEFYWDLIEAQKNFIKNKKYWKI